MSLVTTRVLHPSIIGLQMDFYFSANNQGNAHIKKQRILPWRMCLFMATISQCPRAWIAKSLQVTTVGLEEIFSNNRFQRQWVQWQVHSFQTVGPQVVVIK